MSLAPLEDVKSRYEELVNLRETQPEREAAAAISALQKSRRSSEALISALRAEILACKENHPAGGIAAAACVTNPSAELTAENERLRSELDQARAALAISQKPTSADLEARLAFFELLTGLRIEEMSGNVARCVVSVESAKEGAGSHMAKFDLDMEPADGEPGDVEYVPTDLSECAPSLPEYLKDSIICGWTPLDPCARDARWRPNSLPHAFAGDLRCPDASRPWMTSCPFRPQSSARSCPHSYRSCSPGSRTNE